MRHLLYPSFCAPNFADKIANQFAFRPSGSTTSALVAILSHISGLLETNDFVHVISLDFSKAFDTVSHASLFNKLANLNISDTLYNWLLSFFSNRSHTTRYNGKTSAPCPINAGIVQGSALGPPSFVVTASDLTVVTNGNILDKYADDTYLIVPSSNTGSISAELANISKWAAENNLKLNATKSKELVVTKPRYKTGALPPPFPQMERVSSLNILGITITTNLSMTEHVNIVGSKCAQIFYGLKILKNFGLPTSYKNTVFRALVISKITYASPAWRGYLSSADFCKLTSLISKGRKWDLLSEDIDLELILDKADAKLFCSMLSNGEHVLSSFLPPVRQLAYSLRPSQHQFALPCKSRFNEKNFITRMLHKDTY